jgi:hypothetical protein
MKHVAFLLVLVAAPAAAQSSNPQVVSGSGSSATVTSNAAPIPKGVPSVISGGLTVAPESCGTVNSVGGSGSGFGAIFGFSSRDEDCSRRMNSRHIAALGDKAAAKEALCFIDEVRQAYEAAGRPCRIPEKRRHILGE